MGASHMESVDKATMVSTATLAYDKLCHCNRFKHSCIACLGTCGVRWEAECAELLRSCTRFHRLPLVPAGHVESLAPDDKLMAVDLDE